ncbi:MAG: hypothetical protein LBC87_12270 [Fibromonadaceae bacterium]|jgi:hypothetical protein|nr:hypothetical protein [Fibromonadaceae bacterium]
MNISSVHGVTGNNYELRKVSSDDHNPFSIPDDAPKPVSKSGNELQFKGEISTNTHTQNDYRTGSVYMQVDSQRKNEIGETEEQKDNFLQKYVKGDEEDEEEEEDGRLVDYLLKALKGEEEELRAEGNSYMDDEERKKFLKGHCPELFQDLE